MREKEVNKIKKNNLLDSLYFENKKPTWYASFFDKEKRMITARYDKLFYSDKVRIKKFLLFGDKDKNNKTELLSDHLGILVHINLI